MQFEKTILMNENLNIYQKIQEIHFEEINVAYDKSEFIIEYSKLSFNEGFLFKTIEAREKNTFKKVVKSLPKIKNSCDVNIKFQKANECVNDFLYFLISNNSLKSEKWGLNEDENDFFEIVDDYNSLEKFKKLFICELNEIKLHRRLYEVAKIGSIYDNWKLNDRKTEVLINELINVMIPKNKEIRVFELEKWGDSLLGLFKGFLFVNISDCQITFFASDDYD